MVSTWCSCRKNCGMELQWKWQIRVGWTDENTTFPCVALGTLWSGESIYGCTTEKVDRCSINQNGWVGDTDHHNFLCFQPLHWLHFSMINDHSLFPSPIRTAFQRNLYRTGDKPSVLRFLGLIGKVITKGYDTRLFKFRIFLDKRQVFTNYLYLYSFSRSLDAGTKVRTVRQWDWASTYGESY